MKFIWEQLTEAAKTCTDFKSKYNISAFNEKNFFWSVFPSAFLRLQIYEAVAVIFWQSASYVFIFWLSLRVDKFNIFCQQFQVTFSVFYLKYHGCYDVVENLFSQKKQFFNLCLSYKLLLSPSTVVSPKKEVALILHCFLLLVCHIIPSITG